MSYYSYHIFYFPFKWEIAGEEKKSFSEQVDLKHIPISSSSMWERTQIDNVQLSQQVDTKEQEELFAERQYYFDFVHPVLYDMKNAESPIIHHYERREPKERNVEYHIEEKNRTYVLKLDALNSVPKLYVVGCSSWITDCAKQSKLKAKEFLTVPNGVDTAVFTPRESEFAKKYDLKNRFVILGMANKWTDPANKNGVEQLLKELDSDCRVVIVGCDEAKKAFFAPYPNVIAVPFVKEPKELADIYNAADVFVNLTRADTLPTVNMESICCGTPVITFDVCGSPELVDADSGIIVPEGVVFQTAVLLK